MFYNTNTTGRDFLWGEFSISGLSSNIFRAPADGYYAGILFWNDANAPYTNPGSVITGTSHSVFEGVMYFSLYTPRIPRDEPQLGVAADHRLHRGICRKPASFRTISAAGFFGHPDVP